MSSDRRAYLALAGLYALSRALLHALGVRFLVDYRWQHFHDLDLLRDRLWESLLYSHAFPPFMNALAGVVLKTAPGHAAAIYHALFLAFGLGFALAVLYLLRAVDLPRAPALLLTGVFICSPTFIYLEKLLHYELPAAAMLAGSAVLLHRALLLGTTRSWLAFFFACAAIAYTRLTFHLVWVAGMVALALLFERRQARRILMSALLPLLLVLALYAKNQVLFGFFGASSRSGFSLALMTTRQLPTAERRVWQKRGWLHPASRLSVYSGADAYAAWVDLSRTTGIPVLDRVRKADGEANYNHHALIDVSALLLEDGRRYVAKYPRRYLSKAVLGIFEYLSPSTRWHPRDPEGSPHQAIRGVLEPWEDAYNAAWHSFPRAPYGLYALLLPLVLAGLLLASWALWRERMNGCAREKLIVFMTLNIAYVPALSCLATYGELARYRFLVEAFMWVVAAFAVRRGVGLVRGGRGRG